MNKNTRLPLMLYMEKYLFILPLLAFTFLIPSCKEDESSTTPPTIQSTALRENPATVHAPIINYTSHLVTLDTSMLEPTSGRVFLKLFHRNGDVLYLGVLQTDRSITLKVDVLLDDKSLNYEIFSDDHNMQTLSGILTI